MQLPKLPLTEEQTHLVILGLLGFSIILLIVHIVQMKNAEHFRRLRRGQPPDGINEGFRRLRRGDYAGAPPGQEGFRHFRRSNPLGVPDNEGFRYLQSSGDMGGNTNVSGTTSGIAQQQVPAQTANFNVQAAGCTLNGTLASSNPDTAGSIQQLKSHIRARRVGGL